jgi:hypothetical protein
METFVRKTKSNEWLFREKKLFLCNFTYIYTDTVYIIAHMVGMITEAFRKNGSRLYAWWLTKTFRTQKSTKVWITNKIFRNHKSTKFGWLTKTFRKHAKIKGYIQQHKIRQCCKQFSWPNSRQYCNSVQNFVLTQKITQSNYKCWEKFIEIWF